MFIVWSIVPDAAQWGLVAYTVQLGLLGRSLSGASFWVEEVGVGSSCLGHGVGWLVDEGVPAGGGR